MTKTWVTAFCIGALILTNQATAAGWFKADHPHLAVTLLFSSHQCAYDQHTPYADLLETQADVNAFFKDNGKTGLTASRSEAPAIDFARETVAAVWMGKKGTAGYRIELGSNIAAVKDQSAFVQVNFMAPDAKAVLAQIMTSPCLLIKLPKGAYHTLDVVSQNGDLIGRLSLRKSS